MGFRDWFDRLRGRPRPQRGRQGRSENIDSPYRRPQDDTLLLSGSRASVPPPPQASSGYRAHGSTAQRPLAQEIPPPPKPMHSTRGGAPAIPYVPPVPQATPHAHAPSSRALGDDSVARTVYHAQSSPQEQIVGVLVGVGGKLAGELYALRDNENTLGRDPKCEVRFPERDPRISRRHAQIVHKNGLFAIKPLNPDNPTFVNRERILEVAELPDGAEISIGTSEFRFRSVLG